MIEVFLFEIVLGLIPITLPGLFVVLGLKKGDPIQTLGLKKGDPIQISPFFFFIDLIFCCFRIKKGRSYTDFRLHFYAIISVILKIKIM